MSVRSDAILQVMSTAVAARMPCGLCVSLVAGDSDPKKMPVLRRLLSIARILPILSLKQRKA
jgi:hypothetical protein